MSKSIFKSKMFWINALGIAADVGGLVPGGGNVVTVLSLTNIGLRYITSGSVHIRAPKETFGDQIRKEIRSRRSR